MTYFAEIDSARLQYYFSNEPEERERIIIQSDAVVRRISRVPCCPSIRRISSCHRRDRPSDLPLF